MVHENRTNKKENAIASAYKHVTGTTFSEYKTTVAAVPFISNRSQDEFPITGKGRPLRV
jgi:hypothetical protein